MRRTREQQKQALVAQAEELVEQLLDWEEQTAAPTFQQMEERVLKFREQLGQQAVQVLLAGQEAKQLAVGPKCSHCQQEMRYKGQKSVLVESRLGAVPVERGYYYCSACQAGLFPPG